MELAAALDSAATAAAMARTVVEPWPVEAFTKTTITERQITEPCATRAVLLVHGSDADRALIDRLAAHFPSVTALLDRPAGRVTVLANKDVELFANDAPEGAHPEPRKSGTTRTLTVGVVTAKEKGSNLLTVLNDGVQMRFARKTRDGDLVVKVKELTPSGGATFADILRKDTGMDIDVREALAPHRRLSCATSTP